MNASRRILVTGGTGFFGKSMLECRLHDPQARETALVILSRDPMAFLSRNPRFRGMENVEWVKGNVLDSRLSHSVVGPFDSIVHAAAVLDPALPAGEFERVVVGGTGNVIALAKSCRCGRILFTSSGAVYGPQTQPVGEEASCRPITPYGRAKLMAEDLLLESGLDIRIARCFSFAGPHLDRTIYYAIGNFIQDCLDGKDIVIKGDGTPLRSYLHADDLVEWLFAILERGEPGRAYNVGSPEAISIGDLAARVRLVLGAKGEVRILGRPEGGPPSVYVPKVDRAREELGLEVRIGLDDAIRRSVAV